MRMRVLSQPAGRRRPAYVAIALCVAAALGLTACSTSSHTVPADATKVLQSVSVSMSSNGTTTELTSQAVSTNGQASSAVTTSTSFSPDAVAADLPFRVLTSYRTADSTGTDLADLAGKSGRIEIDLTIENLTVQAKDLNYDSAGAARTQSAMVGVPLTVVASAELGTQPDAVVISGSDAVTNGVLSQNSQGQAVVQWATILASPQLSSSGTLRLVVNADDFKVPDFDLSVQPGLITDPSINVLLDSAFSPDSSKEFELESNTIKLIGEVNGVLAEASKSISTVRKNLNKTSETLGSKTVKDLKESSTRIAASVKALDTRINSLGDELSANLKDSQSMLLSLLEESVTAINQVLGDTSASPPSIDISGSGCGATVGAGASDSSVYGSVLRVAAQLEGYSRTTGACREEIRQALIDTVGPSDPSATTCTSAESVTCALFNLKTTFATIATDLVTAGDSAVATLDSANLSQAVTAYNELNTDIEAVVSQTETVMAASPGAAITTNLDDLAGLLGTSAATGSNGTLGRDLAALSSEVDDLFDTATAARSVATELVSANTDVADQLCDLVASGDLTADKASGPLSELTGEDCNGDPIAGAGTPMSSRLADQVDAWNEVLAATRTSDSSQGLGQAIAKLQTDLATARTKLAAARQAVNNDQDDLDSALAELNTRVQAMDDSNTTLAPLMAGLELQQANLEAAIRTAFQNAASSVSDNAGSAIDTTVRQVSTNVSANVDDLDAAFARSSAGLSAAASDITTDTKRVIDSQQGKAEAAASEAAASIEEQVSADLADIAQGVGAASKDAEAAGKLLTSDLRRVLLDLGVRKVKGSGLLGAMATSAATADSADYHLALASQRATSYSNVRASEVDGLLLRRAQVDASMQALADLPAFGIDIPAGAEHLTVYSIQIAGSK